MTRWRRLVLVAGVTLLVAGLALFGYLGWEFWGTNWVSHRHQHQALQQLQQGWDKGTSSVQTSFGTATAIVEIPRFGENYQIPVFEGTSQDILAAGFGHYDGTAGPGQVGNYALAAHRITHGQPLRDMPDLQAGDLVRIVTRTTTYVYRLTTGGSDLVVPDTATWVLDQLPHNPGGGVEPAQQQGQRLLTLTTCAELFHTDNRMVAFGILVRTKTT